ncbi:RER1, partial [Asbolus verrucosus]
IYQSTLDRWTPHSRCRWLGTLALLLGFGIRIVAKQWYQGVVDRTVPWQKTRWLSAFLLILVFMARVLYAQGWYIVTYALGIYHLNLFIAFLTPKIDPAMDFDAEENGPELPTRANEEFRPFIRRLPEFKFWYSVTKSTLIDICLLHMENQSIKDTKSHQEKSSFHQNDMNG